MVQRREGLRIHHAGQGDRDLFVHYSGIDGRGFKSLAENAKVEYEEEVGDKGPKAVNVRLI